MVKDAAEVVAQNGVIDAQSAARDAGRGLLPAGVDQRPPECREDGERLTPRGDSSVVGCPPTALWVAGSSPAWDRFFIEG